MTKYYTFPDSETSAGKILEYFKFLENIGYKIISKEVIKYYVNIIYENEIICRRIEITNATNYTDYGFSIFIYNTENENKRLYNMIVNIPYEKQDKECNFMKKQSEYLNKNYEELINKESWYEMK
jgi:hypothetical protein